MRALGETLGLARTYLRFWGRLNLLRRPAATLLAVTAVAAAAALATAVETASRSVRDEAARAAAAVVGSGDFEISSSGRVVPEALIEAVRGVSGVQAATPVVAETVWVDAASGSSIPIHVLGLDLLEPDRARDFDVVRESVVVRDPLRLLALANAILISEHLAERLGVEPGEALPVRAPSGRYVFSVQGLIVDSEFARAFGGQIAVADIWALQHLVAANGFVDRIEVVAEPGVLDVVGRSLEEVVGSAARVRRIVPGEGAQLPLTRALDLLLWGVTVSGVLAASILAYAAVSQLVLNRLRTFAVLRCLGVGGAGISVLILLDAFAVSSAGTLVGLGGGFLVSPLLVKSLSQLSEHLGDLTIHQAELSASTAGIAALVTLGVALLSAIQPIRTALKDDPLEYLEGSGVRVVRPRVRKLRTECGAVGVLLIAGLACSWPSGFAVARLAAVTLLGTSVVLLCAPDVLRLLGLGLRAVWSRTPPLGPVVGAMLLARPTASAMSLAAVASTLFFVIALRSTVGSLVDSMDAMIAGSGSPTAVVSAGAPVGGFDGERLIPRVLDAIRRTPGVQDLAPAYLSTVVVDGEEVRAHAVDAEILQRRGTFSTLDTPPAQKAAALLRGELVVTRPFAEHFAKGLGSEVTLLTKDGARGFRIGGFSRNYVGPTGTVTFDVETFRKHFTTTGPLVASVWSDAPFEEIARRIQERVGNEQPLFFESAAEGYRRARSRAARYSGLLDLVSATSAVFCAVAVLNLLAIGVATRAREFSAMQVVGVKPWEVAVGLAAESFIVGVLGLITGVLLGIAAGRIVCELLLERLGWFVDYRASAEAILAPAAWIAGLCALVGMLCALRVRKQDPLAALDSR